MWKNLFFQHRRDPIKTSKALEESVPAGLREPGTQLQGGKRIGFGGPSHAVTDVWLGTKLEKKKGKDYL